MTVTLPHSDGDFWTAPERDRDDLSFRVLLENPVGFLLGAPGEVDLTQRNTLPLIGFYKCTNTDSSKKRLNRSSVLVVSRRETSRVYAAAAFELREGKKRVPGKGPEGESCKYFSLEARSRLADLPWRDGTLRLQMLSFDHVSAPCEVRLVSEASRDLDIKAFVDAHRTPGYPQPPFPAPREAGEEEGPYYTQDPDSPAAPTEPGFAVTLAPVCLIEATEPQECWLRATLRLPVLPREVARPAPDVEGETENDRIQALWDTGWRDLHDPAVKAVVPVSLLMLRAGTSAFQHVRLQVPVYEEPNGDEPVTGCLNLDLLDLPGVNLSRGKYALYLVHGAATAGPFMLSAVTPDMLPEPGE
jgi:hypothetical protein